MFHVKNNLFFGRTADGSVRVLQFAAPPRGWPKADDPPSDAATFDITIDSSTWCSVVATVSTRGEEHGRFYMAEDFHNGRPVRGEAY